MPPPTSDCLLRHWRAAMAANWSEHNRPHQGRQSRRAICMTGQLRLFGLSALNMLWTLRLGRPGSDLFFVGPADASYRLHIGFLSELATDWQTYDEDIDSANLGEAAPLWERNGSRMRLNTAHARRLGFLTRDARGVQQRMLHMAIQLWQMQACADLLQRHERSSQAQYETVVRLRPDAYFWQELPLVHPSAHRPRVMEWPFGQDFYFFGERVAGLRMLSVLGDVLEPMLATRGVVPAESCCLIWQLWDHALDVGASGELHAADDGRFAQPHLHLIEGVGAVFVGKLLGCPACGWWSAELESPDPEGMPTRPDGMWLLPALPVGMLAAVEAAGRECLGVRYDRRGAGGCRLSTSDARTCAMGDPGVNTLLHVRRRGGSGAAGA